MSASGSTTWGKYDESMEDRSSMVKTLAKYVVVLAEILVDKEGSPEITNSLQLGFSVVTEVLTVGQHKATWIDTTFIKSKISRIDD